MLALAALLVGCDGTDDVEPEVDPDLVGVIVDLHLADARSSLDTTQARAGLRRDSLRQTAYLRNDTDSIVVARQLDALAEDPDLAKAVYDVVDARLSLERQGVVPVPDSIPVGATAVPTDSAAPGTAADRTVPPP